MARLMGQRSLHGLIAHMPGVQDELFDQAYRIGRIANGRLQHARSTTEWYKIIGPGDLTEIRVGKSTGKYGKVDSKYSADWLVSMYAPNAMAIEFGHAPSGVFGPGGRYGHIKTKAPFGLYIMTGAYILA